jgi:hypothetical protein
MHRAVHCHRLGCLNVSLEGHAACLKVLKGLEVPLLVLGGGGTTQVNSARAWCNATAVLCGVQLPMELPQHPSLDYYTPDYKLSVPLATMENRNTEESLTQLREHALQHIATMPQRTRPPVRVIRDASQEGEARPDDASATGGNGMEGAAASEPVSHGGDTSADAAATPAEGEPMADGSGPTATDSAGGDAMDIEDGDAAGATASEAAASPAEEPSMDDQE